MTVPAEISELPVHVEILAGGLPWESMGGASQLVTTILKTKKVARLPGSCMVNPTSVKLRCRFVYDRSKNAAPASLGSQPKPISAAKLGFGTRSR